MSDSGTAVAAADPLVRLWQLRDVEEGAADAVYATLREAILRGDLPPGSRLGEDDLARRCGTSRTPVREALFRLETARLAQRSGRRGLVVRRISPDEIIEVFVVREAIEGLSARTAAHSATPADIVRMRRMNDALAVALESTDVDRMASINVSFHELICKVSRNGLLFEFMQQVHDRVRQFPATTFSRPERRALVIAEHARIIDAIEARDSDKAENTARHHMRLALETRIEMLEEASPI
jgi:DNA-binding GntR family transcriptional regulator